MGALAVIIGSSALAPDGSTLAGIAEEHGAVGLHRHGAASYALPHEIDHEGNLRSLVERGCDRVLAIGSVGSLKEGLGVGTFVCPHDFIALQLSITTLGDARAHAPAGFDDDWRAAVLAAWRTAGADPLVDGGVYWHTTGPRFETPAEIRLIAAHADVVGMTLAAECVVAGELGLRYAAVCAVDNLANGIGDLPLSTGELEAARAVNVQRIAASLESVVPELTA